MKFNIVSGLNPRDLSTIIVIVKFVRDFLLICINLVLVKLRTSTKYLSIYPATMSSVVLDRTSFSDMAFTSSTHFWMLCCITL